VAKLPNFRRGRERVQVAECVAHCFAGVDRREQLCSVLSFRQSLATLPAAAMLSMPGSLCRSKSHTEICMARRFLATSWNGLAGANRTTVEGIADVVNGETGIALVCRGWQYRV
jgi:hypothetical protein